MIHGDQNQELNNKIEMINDQLHRHHHLNDGQNVILKQLIIGELLKRNVLIRNYKRKKRFSIF